MKKNSGNYKKKVYNYNMLLKIRIELVNLFFIAFFIYNIISIFYDLFVLENNEKIEKLYIYILYIYIYNKIIKYNIVKGKIKKSYLYNIVEYEIKMIMYNMKKFNKFSDILLYLYNRIMLRLFFIKEYKIYKICNKIYDYINKTNNSFIGFIKENIIAQFNVLKLYIIILDVIINKNNIKFCLNFIKNINKNNIYISYIYLKNNITYYSKRENIYEFVKNNILYYLKKENINNLIKNNKKSIIEIIKFLLTYLYKNRKEIYKIIKYVIEKIIRGK
jgi:hypothetical protein